MITNVLYFFLAFLGLGFLIFIHELAHYFVARRMGMKIEVFSIGFGKPIYSWVYQGVKWQLAMLPFGGYVRIHGMEKKGSVEPYKMAGGFFSKSPWARIQVALAGPVANLGLGLLIFAFIWMGGGRLKPFSDTTTIVGWVDPTSVFKEEGVSQGDVITKVGGQDVHNFNTILHKVIFDQHAVSIEGSKRDYWNAQTKDYQFTFQKNSSLSIEQQVGDLRGLQPASFLIYSPGNKRAPESGSPMENSGILPGDRIVWVDGEIVFSLPELSSIINKPRVLLTVQRGNSVFLAKVPRLMVSDLCLTEEESGELSDFRSEAGLEPRLTQLYFLPYTLSNDAVVQKALTYVDESSEHCSSFDPLVKGSCSSLERSLVPGDRILAVDGKRVVDAFDVLRFLQERKVLIAVYNQGPLSVLSWKTADETFVNEIPWNDLHTMVESIGTSRYTTSIGKLRFLNPVMPLAFVDLPTSDTKMAWAQHQVAIRDRIDKIKDLDEKVQALKVFEQEQKKLRLGIVLQDAIVRYNPGPFVLFEETVSQTWQTLKALLSLHITPKAVAGPVGIVQVMQKGWLEGTSEAMYWLAVISINLGIFNLLPIPVLDGGHICFALWEAITKQKLKMKTMDRLIIPFVMLLIVLFIFTTYNDIARLLKSLF